MAKVLKDNLNENTIYAVEMEDKHSNKGLVRKYVNLDEDLVNLINRNQNNLNETIFYDELKQEYFIIYDSKKYTVSETEITVIYKLTKIRYESAILVSFARKKELNQTKDLSLKEVMLLVNSELDYSDEDYDKLDTAIKNIEYLVSRISDRGYYEDIAFSNRFGSILMQLKNHVGQGLSRELNKLFINGLPTSNSRQLSELVGSKVEYDDLRDEVVYHKDNQRYSRRDKISKYPFNVNILTRIKECAVTNDIPNKEEVVKLADKMISDSQDKESILSVIKSDYLADEVSSKYNEKYKEDIEIVMGLVDYLNFSESKLVEDLKNAMTLRTVAIKSFIFRRNEKEVINLLQGTVLNRKISVTYMKELLLSTKQHNFLGLFNYNNDGDLGIPKGVVLYYPQHEIRAKVLQGIDGKEDDYLREVAEYFNTEDKLYEISKTDNYLNFGRGILSVKLGDKVSKVLSGDLDFKIGEFTETNIDLTVEDISEDKKTVILPVLKITQRRRKLEGEVIVDTLIDKTKPSPDTYSRNKLIKVVDRNIFNQEDMVRHINGSINQERYSVRGTRGATTNRKQGIFTNLSQHTMEILGKTLVDSESTESSLRYNKHQSVLVNRVLKRINENHDIGFYLSGNNEKSNLIYYVLLDNLVGELKYKTQGKEEVISYQNEESNQDKVRELFSQINFLDSVEEYEVNYTNGKHKKLSELTNQLKDNLSQLIENLISVMEKSYKYSLSQNFKDILTADIARESNQLIDRGLGIIGAITINGTVLKYSKDIEDIINKYNNTLKLSLIEEDGRYNIVENMELIYQELNKLYEEINNYLITVLKGNVLNIASSQYTKSDNKQYKEYFINYNNSIEQSTDKYGKYKELNKYFTEGYNLKHKLKTRGILDRAIFTVEERVTEIFDVMEVLGITKDSDKMTVLDYLVTDCEIRQCINLSGAVGTYRDYITMYESLVSNGIREVSNFNLTPYSLKLEHDIVMKEFEVIKSKIDEKKFLEKYENHKQLGLTNIKLERTTREGSKEYCIVEPNNGEDLKDEGRELNHCVGSYTRRILNNQSLIYFIREVGKETESYLTLEVVLSEGKYRLGQVRGMSNKSLSSVKWKKELSSRLSLVSRGTDCSDTRRDKHREELIERHNN